MVSNIASAISARVSAVNSGIIGTVPQSNLAQFIKTNGEAAMNGGIDSKRLLGTADFALPLSGGGDGAFSTVGMWLKGEYKSLSGEVDDLDWDGDLSGFHVGLDYQVSADTLFGIALSRQQGDFDVSSTTESEYEVELTTVSPYIAWQVDGLDFVGSVGYSSGEGELVGKSGGNKATHDLTTLSGSLAVDGQIKSVTNFDLRGRGELLYSSTEIEEKGKSDERISASRLRVGVEANYPTHQFASGGSLSSTLESAVRVNFGDGQSGSGMEVGGGLRYQSADARVSVDGKVRGVVGGIATTTVNGAYKAPFAYNRARMGKGYN